MTNGIEIRKTVRRLATVVILASVGNLASMGVSETPKAIAIEPSQSRPSSMTQRCSVLPENLARFFNKNHSKEVIDLAFPNQSDVGNCVLIGPNTVVCRKNSGEEWQRACSLEPITDKIVQRAQLAGIARGYCGQ